jgi:hypothetical protein
MGPDGNAENAERISLVVRGRRRLRKRFTWTDFIEPHFGLRRAGSVFATLGVLINEDPSLGIPRNFAVSFDGLARTS